MYSKITGTGSYFPDKVLTNADLEKIVDTSDEWITSRTGIKERRISENETTSDMAFKASLEAINSAGLESKDIDGVILATCTPDYLIPSSACLLAAKLNLKTPYAFDINAACSGFIYALGVADSLIKNGLGKNILVVGAERLSSIIDWTDRNTCILLGDGAGAAVLSASSEPGIRSICMQADGEYAEILTCRAGGSNALYDRDNFNIKENLFFMKGNEVFKIAVRSMAEIAVEAVEKSGLALEDVDYFIPHQANVRIIDAAAKRLKLEHDKVIITLDKFGNTSAATIPTALDISVKSGKIKKGDNVVSAAFGGGLTWASIFFTM
ncbi:MAG: 3-oxoacyl-[acyl-carrier-protein] synthase [Deferribacteres bacterium]|jgi:3-oxoacyl-[acyl-carrier-protein] synthase-3|nr:3-oxoacyl-[acyl-carrier-protein] synthase [Deferribacteraceae bacterium]MDK2792251.1 3-oxoacyl-[acyl-carrier-protein] synthase [Deferribacteres bacterium]